MKSRILLLMPVIIGLVAGGCMSSSESAIVREPHVKPSLVLLTADQAARRGIKIEPAGPAEAAMPKEISALDSSSVIAPPNVKVYTVNRAVDPADPELMHEEHVAYRRESSPMWKIDAPAEQKILVGPRITDGRQDLQPVLNKELAAYLADQRRVTAANQKAIAALFDAIDALNRQQQTLARREAAPAKHEATVPTPVEGETPAATTP